MSEPPSVQPEATPNGAPDPQTGLLASAVRCVSALGEAAKADDVLMALQTVAALKERVKKLTEDLELRAIKFIQAHGELSDGATRYYVAPNKSHKTRDLAAAIKAVASSCKGDWTLFTTMFSSSALKPGACRKLLGPQWGDHFYTVETADLKTGEIRERLQAAPVDPAREE